MADQDVRPISVDEARAFFAHKSQQIMGITPETLPADGVEYWACGPVCGVFNFGLWPGVWMGHYAVKPASWGNLTDSARMILVAFWDAKQATRIIGWTDSKNRAALAFSRRLGFVVDGEMPTKEGKIIMQGWTKWA